MASKRGPMPISLSTSDSLSPASPVMARSASPSSGFTNFLKPTKWFSRSASTGKVHSDSRSLTPSGSRKPKISKPTDPRPILDVYSNGASSRSVLDLSGKVQNSFDIPRFPHTPSTPSSPTSSAGLGDLRNISKRGWSRSADDLSRSSPIPFSPVKASFQDRVAEYRARSESVTNAVSSGSAASPTSSGRHPFPTLATTPPSMSPAAVLPGITTPRSATLPSMTVSISTPVLEDSNSLPQNLTPTHVHTRSHSFTPRLPSKLASPAYSLSPVCSQTTHRSTTFLAPPLIIEPDVEVEEPNEKRSSQILVHSGFVNRLTDVPTNLNQANLQLSKGWKPYKLELKGSRLHFYKPPSDRTAAIKDLFPTGLVPPSQEGVAGESDAVEADGVSEEADGKGRQTKAREDGSGGGTLGKRKRAFWGRRTHPDLVLDGNGRISTGTFEALAHEAVFGTSFARQEAPQDPPSEEWKEFAAGVVFALPSVVGRATCEQELLRCCSYLVSGAEEQRVTWEKRRVVWLANEYLRQHGTPVDAAGWQAWKQETIPDADLGAESFSATSGMPSSNSTQAVYASTPVIEASSEFNTFSPRPENAARVVPLLEALTSLSSGPSRIPWHVLHEDGLTRDLLLQLDPFLLAQSLTLYHRSILEQSPANLTVDLLLPPDGGEEVPSLASSLFGTDDQPHWLTKTILLQIFEGHAAPQGPTGAAPGSSGRKSEDRLRDHSQQQQQQQQQQSNTSRTHSRSEIIGVWAKVAESCRRGGDECSWRAIGAALCSRPVSRLEKAWKRVDPQALEAVESWISAGGDGTGAVVNDPQLTPWAGSLKELLGEELGRRRREGVGEQMLSVDAFKRAQALFEEFKAVYTLCPRNAVVTEEIGSDVGRMVAFWKEVAEGGRTSGMAIKYQRVEQFMSLSLAAEPRRKGLFEPYFWQRQSSPQTPNSALIPLLFPEPLPAQTLVDRTQVVRSRVESDAVEVHQYLRSNSNENRAGNHPLHRLDFNQDFTKQLILGQTGPVISVCNGDLLLMVQPGGLESVPPSRGPSRPSSCVVPEQGSVEKTSVSRAPSIRVKPSTSDDLHRKTSMARRSSLPSVSHRQNQNYVISETSSDPPLRVIVQAGSLDNLVNVLVYGLGHISVSVADDNGEMTLKEGMTRELVVDRVEFARIWWNSFRSFVTPFVFFELLRKLYITSQPAESDPPVEEYLHVATRRKQVLTTFKEWLLTGGGAQDMLDDVQLYASVQTFLESTTDDIVHKAAEFEDPAVQQAWSGFEAEKAALSVFFVSQTRRPHNQTRVHPVTNGARVRHAPSAPRDPPDLDRKDPEVLVDNLDGMACAAFSNVTEEDLYITADLLEVQTSDKTAWFSSREPANTDEGTEIQCLYSHIQQVEPSSFIPEPSQDVLYRLLPPGVRSCIRAYAIIRKWLVSKIVAPRLGLRKRQARMELLLQAIEVARLRNAETPGSAAPSLLQPCVRSFVEAVVSSALLSVESRMHHRAWQSVALGRRCQSDSLASLLMRPHVQTTTSSDCLTVDVGWLLERMLEVMAGPDVLESSSQEGQNLVNFDKRRHLCNLINKAWALPSSRKHPPSDEANRRGFERLNNIEKEVYHLQFDHRGIKEEATREATQVGANGPSSSKKTVRPFYKIVGAQIEKNRRDKILRIRLQREKVMEQSRSERRDDFLNRAMKGPRTKQQQPISASHSGPKQHRNKKSMSAFLNFMRPISSAFGADMMSPSSATMLKKSPAELDFVPSGKPALVLSILDARVAQFINNERSYMFQLETEDGGHYLLQSMNKKDMNKWLEIISKVTHSVAQRRLTYLGSSPKPQISDHIHDRAMVASRDPLAVFGVELEFLLQREALGGDIPPGTVPRVINDCLTEIEARGLTEVGIYRIAGATLEINALKDSFNLGGTPISSSTDIHAVCDLVKSWFRVLPEPVFPSDSYYEVMQAIRLENLDERLAKIRAVVQGLPRANFDLLRRVAEHLDRVTECEEHNHMTAEALAIVFSPNLLRAPQNNFAMILNNMGLSHKLVKAFITHLHAIFNESDPEADVHSDDEYYEAPILEEDEDEYLEEESNAREYHQEGPQNLSSPDLLELEEPQSPIHHHQSYAYAS